MDVENLYFSLERIQTPIDSQESILPLPPKFNFWSKLSLVFILILKIAFSVICKNFIQYIKIRKQMLLLVILQEEYHFALFSVSHPNSIINPPSS